VRRSHAPPPWTGGEGGGEGSLEGDEGVEGDGGVEGVECSLSPFRYHVLDTSSPGSRTKKQPNTK